MVAESETWGRNSIPMDGAPADKNEEDDCYEDLQVAEEDVKSGVGEERHVDSTVGLVV